MCWSRRFAPRPRAQAIVAYLREQVAALPAVLTADGTHPLVRLYGQERDRAARVAREAVALGLEERRVRVDEATTARLISCVVGALEDVGDLIPAEALPAVRAAIGQRIRATSPASLHESRGEGTE